ncbi:hypothetical protein Tco_1576592 [Tanacetum coccineum]
MRRSKGRFHSGKNKIGAPAYLSLGIKSKASAKLISKRNLERFGRYSPLNSTLLSGDFLFIKVNRNWGIVGANLGIKSKASRRINIEALILNDFEDLLHLIRSFARDLLISRREEMEYLALVKNLWNSDFRMGGFWQSLLVPAPRLTELNYGDIRSGI